MLPRLLLISEVPLSEQGTGINRTLVNLLEDYPPEQFMLCTSRDPALTISPFNENVATFSAGHLPILNNRVGTIANESIVRLNLQMMEWLPIPNQAKIEDFSPEVILICPNSASALLMGYKLVQTFDIPYLVYFMDDWVYKNHAQWLTGSVQATARYILTMASGWLMISDRLKADLSERYDTAPSRSLIVHNPVDFSRLSSPDFSPHEGTFKIVYAGSIWGMHYDAVAVIASAVFELRQAGEDIEFILHTPQICWDQYQPFWTSREVTYGSLIPYHVLQTYLKRADLLLVASSFRAKYAHITRSSVQTKLTDYMASGRPILSFGPADCACNSFVNKWNCGLICETYDISAIKLLLQQAMKTRVNNQSLAKRGFDILANVFEKSKVSRKLFEFIQTTSYEPALKKTREIA